MTKARGNANRHSAAAAQHNTHAVIATLNVASRLVYPQPEYINLRAQHHQGRWRWSKASRSRGAACLYKLLLEEEPSFIYEDRAHTRHTTQHTTKQKQQSKTHNQHHNNLPNYRTTSQWKTPARFLLPRRVLRSESWDSDIVRRALALLFSRPEAVIFR